MTVKLRSDDDADYPNKLYQSMPFRTDITQKEVRCAACGRLYYVDDETLERIENAMEYDEDNQFLCEECELDYQDEIFE